jgi:aminopeptidase N
VARIRAADTLAEKPSTRVVKALGTQLKRDPFWGAQQRIARAIGRIGGDAARDALVAALNVPHPKARRVVVEALGWFRNDPVAAEALEKMARKGDKSYYVEAELARALGKANTPKALAMLKTMLRKPAHIEVIRAGAYDGLAELGLREGYALCAAGARYGAPEMGRAAAIAAAARLAQIHPDLRKPCLELLTGIAEHKDNPAGTFRGKLAALRALLRLGDLDALASLARVQESEADGRIVRLARVTAQRLRKQADKPQEMQSLRDDLDKIVRENKSLRERMDSLETGGEKKKPAPKKAAKR